jgi:hypothetical protein
MGQRRRKHDITAGGLKKKRYNVSVYSIIDVPFSLSLQVYVSQQMQGQSPASMQAQHEHKPNMPAHCIEILTRPKILVFLCHPSCQDPRHNTALTFLKFIVLCRVSDRAKMSCIVSPQITRSKSQLYQPPLVHVLHQECTSDHQVSNSNELALEKNKRKALVKSDEKIATINDLV